MSHSESLAVSIQEHRPARCQFSKGHAKSTCHCAGSGWVIGCEACEGSGWDRKKQAPCARCNGYGGFSVPLCEGYAKPGVKCEAPSTEQVNEHRYCSLHKPGAA